MTGSYCKNIFVICGPVFCDLDIELLSMKATVDKGRDAGVV